MRDEALPGLETAGQYTNLGPAGLQWNFHVCEKGKDEVALFAIQSWAKTETTCSTSTKDEVEDKERKGNYFNHEP